MFRVRATKRQRSALPRRRLMDESGDDFLAGARFAVDEHRRIDGRHAQCARENALPLARSPDYPAVSRDRLGPLSDDANARGDSFGAASCFRAVALHGSKLFVCHRYGHAVGNVKRPGDVVGQVRIRLLRQESELHDLVLGADLNAEQRTVPGRHDSIDGTRPAVSGSRSNAPQIVHDSEFLVTRTGCPSLFWKVSRRARLQGHSA